MPNPAWDDPSTSHVFHPPQNAPTPSAPDLEDLTRGADALRQMIEAAEDMGDDSDDEYLELAVGPISRHWPSDQIIHNAMEPIKLSDHIQAAQMISAIGHAWAGCGIPPSMSHMLES
jgi:hypothetical protein